MGRSPLQELSLNRPYQAANMTPVISCGNCFCNGECPKAKPRNAILHLLCTQAQRLDEVQSKLLKGGLHRGLHRGLL